MRRLLSILGLVAALGVSHAARADDDDWDDEARAQQAAQVNQATFQEQLQPYGQWESDGTYGQVFYPEVAADWRPYTYGHWAWTDAGWLWVSNEPFGWATFHYGRWWYNPYRHHWGWVPGYEWAPAWVTFRFGGASIGWAPLYVGYDGWVSDYPIYYDHWNFVPCEHFYGGEVYTYVYAPTYVRTVFYSTQVSTGYVGTTSYGPPTTYVAAHSAVPITTTPITHAASPAEAVQANAHGSSAVAVYQPPTTRIYNPSSPAPAALRGPAAAHTPIVAPPTVRGAFNSPTFARTPQAQPQVNQAPSSFRPSTPSAGMQRPSGPMTQPQRGEFQRPGQPQVGTPRPSGPAYGGFNGTMNRPASPSGNPSNRFQAPVAAPPNNYRPQRPAPVQQAPARPQFNAPPHAFQQQPQFNARPQAFQQQPQFNAPSRSFPQPAHLEPQRQTASAFRAPPQMARPSYGGGGYGHAAPSFSAPRPLPAPAFAPPKHR